jgi:hypothetical protein
MSCMGSVCTIGSCMCHTGGRLCQWELHAMYGCHKRDLCTICTICTISKVDTAIWELHAPLGDPLGAMNAFWEPCVPSWSQLVPYGSQVAPYGSCMHRRCQMGAMCAVLEPCTSYGNQREPHGRWMAPYMCHMSCMGAACTMRHMGDAYTTQEPYVSHVCAWVMDGTTWSHRHCMGPYVSCAWYGSHMHCIGALWHHLRGR